MSRYWEEAAHGIHTQPAALAAVGKVLQPQLATTQGVSALSFCSNFRESEQERGTLVMTYNE